MKTKIVFAILAVLGFTKANEVGNSFLNAIESNSNSLCDPNVKQEHGYFNLETGDKHYFYWFFESRSNPSSDPLVLWVR